MSMFSHIGRRKLMVIVIFQAFINNLHMFVGFCMASKHRGEKICTSF